MSDETCAPSGSDKKERAGIGMPASLWLEEFGDLIYLAFGEVAYQVGSSLTGKVWRDVDIRLILDDTKYQNMGFGDPKDFHSQHQSPRWCAYVMAFSALGKQMTGLPIDFQIQSMTQANDDPANDGVRSALIIGAIRRKNRTAFEEKKVQP
jgi:hypothetical protein